VPEGTIDVVRDNVQTLLLGILVIGQRAEPARLGGSEMDVDFCEAQRMNAHGGINDRCRTTVTVMVGSRERGRQPSGVINVRRAIDSDRQARSSGLAAPITPSVPPIVLLNLPNLDVISIKYPRADTISSNYRQSLRRTFHLAVGQAPAYFAM